ncbi:hypothetical protein Mp_1g00520 [Marchantia polymorpha subsp. ruderalis]|uniref:Uncharacterized protein n=2 Tax=Marchantia polymorpha TaxID=3197 RepID=A0AAF6AJZ4_MARPO|nr:hypothetical protein MARPO_0103s0035 [Marchantia polymorpha]BBM96764.1 hypothetical protein Mp_1g00520 [Marchantia polymorpha subsp. ruderalis]|eukprot:PTQ32064.1 hypothetical protein MARPO_0103s0035 [Marchantia polymorpha]
MGYHQVSLHVRHPGSGSESGMSTCKKIPLASVPPRPSGFDEVEQRLDVGFVRGRADESERQQMWRCRD